jgi:hypothetical protein
LGNHSLILPLGFAERIPVRAKSDMHKSDQKAQINDLILNVQITVPMDKLRLIVEELAPLIASHLNPVTLTPRQESTSKPAPVSQLRPATPDAERVAYTIHETADLLGVC